MRNIKLTLNQQNYIETIHHLCLTHGHAHTKAIADMLNVKMASVTEAAQGLAAIGLVNYNVRQTITLTSHGKNIAGELSKRHSILANFFNEILGYGEKRANKIACRMEHIIDPEFRIRLADFIKFMKKDFIHTGRNPLLEFKRRYSKLKGISRNSH